MRKKYFIFFLLLLLAISISTAKADSLSNRLKGKILLQVEQNGEAWYVHPTSGERHYMGKPDDAFGLMRSLGVGITNENLEKIQIAEANFEDGTDSDNDGLSDAIESAFGTNVNSNDSDGDGINDKTEILSGYSPINGNKSAYLLDQAFSIIQKGKIFLQVEQNGEAWYVNPDNNKRYFLGRPIDAFNIMRSLGLGITDNDLLGILMPGQSEKNDSVSNGKMPPDEAIAACSNKQTGDACEFNDRNGISQGVCDNKPGIMACSPSKNEDGGSTADNGGSNQNSNNSNTYSNIKEYESCVYNTEDSSNCKDCCDCLSGADGDLRTECRDTCAVHDFSENSEYIAFDAPSVYGPSGDYSECTDTGNSGDCKACCEDSMGLSCGDYQYCRTACNEKFGEDGGGSTNYYDSSKSEYNIDQAISDRAQENTIAYDALAFFTGNTCADSFIPPGKVADFFGYQYLRDNTPNGMGHNTDFVTNSANNILYILNESQIQQMVDLAKSQIDLVNEYAYKRYPLLVAFRQQLEGDIPSGSTGLSKEAVIDYSEELYLIDAEISRQRAELFGDIIRSLDDEQIAFIDAMVSGGFDSWTPRSNDLNTRSLSKDENVQVMTYASEMFGWYAGSIEADTYFCPERHGTYFGSFYMKDAPAMGNAGYTIDETLTGDKGEAMLTMLTNNQSSLITDLVDIQKSNLNGIVEVREAMSNELRKYLTQDSIDEDYLFSLARSYGALDGENVYSYATHFADVMETLTDSQLDNLMNLRDLEDYPCSDSDIYVYSEKTSRPEIEDTGFLFGL